MKRIDTVFDIIGNAGLRLKARHIAAIMQIGWGLSLAFGEIRGGAFAYLADLLDMSIASFKLYGTIWFFVGALVLVFMRSKIGFAIGSFMFSVYIILGYCAYAISIGNGSPAVVGLGLLVFYVVKAAKENGHVH